MHKILTSKTREKRFFLFAFYEKLGPSGDGKRNIFTRDACGEHVIIYAGCLSSRSQINTFCFVQKVSRFPREAIVYY